MKGPLATYRRSFFDDPFFREFFAPVERNEEELTHGLPAIDLHEQDNRFVLKADLPGIEEKNIKVEYRDGKLTLEAKQEEERTDDKTRLHVKERRSVNYMRTLGFGTDIDANKIVASYKNGTLTVDIPKSTKSTQTIPINVNNR